MFRTSGSHSNSNPISRSLYRSLMLLRSPNQCRMSSRQLKHQCNRHRKLSGGSLQTGTHFRSSSYRSSHISCINRWASLSVHPRIIVMESIQWLTSQMRVSRMALSEAEDHRSSHKQSTKAKKVQRWSMTLKSYRVCLRRKPMQVHQIKMQWWK